MTSDLTRRSGDGGAELSLPPLTNRRRFEPSLIIFSVFFFFQNGGVRLKSDFLVLRKGNVGARFPGDTGHVGRPWGRRERESRWDCISLMKLLRPSLNFMKFNLKFPFPR